MQIIDTTSYTPAPFSILVAKKSNATETQTESSLVLAPQISAFLMLPDVSMTRTVFDFQLFLSSNVNCAFAYSRCI